MRTGSLSDANVIRVITKYYVPVWLSRDHYQMEKPSPAEQAEIHRIDLDRKKKKLPGGSVSVLILDSNGAVLESMRVHQAWSADKLLPVLNQIVKKEKPKARPDDEVDRKIHRVLSNEVADGSALLHVWTRFLGHRSDYGLGEDWVELVEKDWKSLIPKDDARVGEKWDVPEEVASKLYHVFYPPSPNWKQTDGTVEKAVLKGTLAQKTDTDWQIDLTGTVRLKHPFGGKNTPGWVRSKLVGVAHYDPEKKELTSFHLISQDASFVWQYQGKDQPEKMIIAVGLEKP